MPTHNPSWGTPTPQSAQDQYNTLSQQLAGGVGGSFDSPAYYAMRAQRDALVPKLGQQTSASGQAAAANDPVSQARTQILGYTAGRGDAVMNDAMTNEALGRLQGVATGQDAPFTQTVQNQMLAKQAGMNASAESSQAAQLRQQAAGLGGSIADPSYQAKMRELSAQTQSANTSAQGDISTNAQLQNFGARQTANNSLMSGRMGQLGMANSQYNTAAGYLNQSQQSGQHVNGATMPTYNFYGNGSQWGANYQTPGVDKSNLNIPGSDPAAAAGKSAAGSGYDPNMLQPMSHGSGPNGGGYSYGAPLISDETQGNALGISPDSGISPGWGGSAAGAAPPPTDSLVLPPSLGGPASGGAPYQTMSNYDGSGGGAPAAPAGNGFLNYFNPYGTSAPAPAAQSADQPWYYNFLNAMNPLGGMQ